MNDVKKYVPNYKANKWSSWNFNQSLFGSKVSYFFPLQLNVADDIFVNFNKIQASLVKWISSYFSTAFESLIVNRLTSNNLGSTYNAIWSLS